MNKRLIVFLADDDEDDRMMFNEALQEVSTRSTLHTATDGEKLISLLSGYENQLPDVVFLDLNMPNKNGKECLKEIRSNPRYAPVPVVIYSTSTNEVDIEQTYMLGANLYFEKPSSYSALVNALADIVSMNWEEHHAKASRTEFRYLATSTK